MSCPSGLSCQNITAPEKGLNCRENESKDVKRGRTSVITKRVKETRTTLTRHKRFLVCVFGFDHTTIFNNYLVTE